jgi:DNA polymerase III subunit alpha
VKGESLSDATVTGEKKAKPGFVHLHNHSHYSLLDGLAKIPEMIDRVVALGMDAVALTDHGAMYGAIEFYKECKARGVKPIIGEEFYVAPRAHTQRENKADTNPYHLILIAKDYQGYLNLIALTTKAHLDGYYYKPRIDKELMREHAEGLICLSACMQGEVARSILAGDLDQAEAAAREHLEIYGEGNYYLELQHHPGFKEQQQINQGKRSLAEKLGIPLVVTRDSHYVNPDDREAHDILLCVQTGKTVEDTERLEMEGEISLCDPEEIAEAFQDVPEAITNTLKIAEACNLEIELGQILLPTFPVPEGKTQASYLQELCEQGLRERYGDEVSPEARERLQYELGVIGGMGFEAYVLIVHDFVSWARERGILVGPGRGSTAGSLVFYVLKITDLDPLRYDLLFERFLNPDRISMPDADIDFADDRRAEVIDYVREKYGTDRVAQIITFGTMAARAAVRDTGRALGMAYGEVDVVAKLIPAFTSLGKAIEQVDELKSEYQNNSRVRKLLEMAKRLEGVVRHASVHAAAVVISDKPLSNYVPVQRAPKGEEALITQYAMGPIDDLGLLKMDFLGLSNLTTLGNALKIIRATTGDELDLEKLPLDDAATYELLSRGDTTGVFQLESSGMRRYLKELGPTVFEDIVAMVALYRPGPMQWIPDFIARKHGRAQVEYLHPSMEEALRPTYGVIVYQEQVMRIAKDMCGFTGGQADTLRKGIAKKIPSVLAKMKQEFIEGAIKTSQVDRSVVEGLWKSLEDFAQYCFNKSHAACYALIAYQTAYLKTHYPIQFMASLMTSDQGDLDRIAIDVEECRRLGIEVVAPSVNESFRDFTALPEAQKIRFGLAAIKNVGTGPVAALIDEREARGPFTDIEDFVKRIDPSLVNRKVLESLTKAGALDELASREDLLGNLDEILAFAGELGRRRNSGQTDIFGALGAEEQATGTFRLYPVSEKLSDRERLAAEKELLGLYVSEHPLDEFGDVSAVARPINTITTNSGAEEVTLLGIVTQVKKIQTRSKETMVFTRLEDRSGALELIVFPRLYKEKPDLWQVDAILRITGKVSTKDRDGNVGTELKVIVDAATPVTPEDLPGLPRLRPGAVPAAPSRAVAHDAPVDPKAPQTEILVVELPPGATPVTLQRLRDILSASPGTSPVSLVLWQGEERKQLQLKTRVTVTEKLLSQVSEVAAQAQITQTG